MKAWFRAVVVLAHMAGEFLGRDFGWWKVKLGSPPFSVKATIVFCLPGNYGRGVIYQKLSMHSLSAHPGSVV